MKGGENPFAAYGRSQSRRAPMSDGQFRQLVDDACGRHNISDIIGRHTTLKKRGTREMVGLCPFHLEKSPSFEVNDSKGTYHCWGCGVGGDHIRFLMEKERLTFREAIEALTGDAFPTISPEERAKRKAENEAEIAQRRELARSIWAKSVPIAGTLGEVYLQSRQIVAKPPSSVRFVSTPRWYDHETGETGRDVPAVVCSLQDVTGAVVGVQCIFLRPDGSGKYDRPRPDGSTPKAKLSFGIIVGSAIRLGPPQEKVILCEGPEDGLTLMQQLPGRSVWVACGTALLPRVQLPAEIQHVTIAGDNNDAGRTAVDEGRAAYMEQGLTVSEIYPLSQYKDWNDELRGVML